MLSAVFVFRLGSTHRRGVEVPMRVWSMEQCSVLAKRGCISAGFLMPSDGQKPLTRTHCLLGYFSLSNVKYAVVSLLVLLVRLQDAIFQGNAGIIHSYKQLGKINNNTWFFE